MLPPVEDTVLQNNPDFAALYNTLTSVVLNPDGSTKNDPAAKERHAVREELKRHRVHAARNNLLIHAISTANPSLLSESKPPPTLGSRRAKPQPRQTSTSTSTSDLPQPLLDLLLLLPPFLQQKTTLSDDQTAVLLNNPPFSDFPTLLPRLAQLISASLHASAVHLARIANPATNPSYVHRTVPSLPSHLSSLTASIGERKTALTQARLSSATTLNRLLQGHAHVLTQLLRLLEAKHGPIARSLESRAAEAALLAQTQNAEVEGLYWKAVREVYSPEVRRALGNYVHHLRDARGRVGEGVRALRGELEGYGVEDGRAKGKERTMREMARVKKEMGKQVDEARADLERLGRA
ncbi:hypothetical protein QBC47DRAFT_435004 [Echria macrotheca]|uniref:Uncharacterized protein n=1 Tax=Echria macrotheca TaxID=438768 RepID=A0AAJ0F2I3_9PEZI|nr:hypothetical protein QBC47DRAFT_435004 [Echria macrotheca]